MPRPAGHVVTTSEFRASCVAILERVRATGRPVYVTKRGKLIAQIIPPSGPTERNDWIGAMQGTAEIIGDIVAPVWTNAGRGARRGT